ncbi:hypothetical protein GWK47_035118 [Chionoecetes opilio]|uniref:Uncharacterized protein n=1 Tax=Chionoecetes opilio TaxID=41210 RepID=A0A8J4YH79_CHIOP|nr:hypothetical protein GWK47_035118 [Chionoecetes opilio]
MASTSDLCGNLVKSAKLSCPVYIIFDKYHGESVKSHERQRRAGGQTYAEFELATATHLHARDEIMKNDEQKSEHNIEMIGEVQNMFDHEEADVSLVSYTFIMLNTGDVKHVQQENDTKHQEFATNGWSTTTTFDEMSHASYALEVSSGERSTY